MADNTDLDLGAGGDKIATKEVSHGGDTTKLQAVTVMGVSGTEGAYTVADIDGSAANGLEVDVTRVVPGTGATNLGKAEDAVHASNDVGVMALGVRADAPASTAANGDYVPLQMSEEGALWTENLPSEVEAGNSSTATLIADAVFTGTGVSLLDHQAIAVNIDASHDSAVDGMQFQFSSDGTNWDISLDFTYTAADGGRIFQFGIYAEYFRVVFTNGGTGQTHFRCQTLLHHETTLTTIHRLVDDASPDRSAEIVKSAIIAQAAGTGDFVPVQATAAGNFKMALEEIDGALAVTLANGMANPTPLLVGSFNMGWSGSVWDRLISGGSNADAIAVDAGGYQYVSDFNLMYNGTTWDRVRGDITNGIDVDVTRVGGTVTVDGSGVTQPISAVALPLPSGAATSAAQLASGHDVTAIGGAAHDAAASGNPVPVSGVAQVTDDTAPPNRVSAEGDVTRMATDLDGAVFVRPHGPQVWSYHSNGSTALTDASVHAAPGAGLSIYVTDIVFSSGAATAINAFLEEGATTVLGPYYLEAVAGRGVSLHFQTPKKITANTALTITTSAAIAHSVDITGFIGAA